MQAMAAKIDWRSCDLEAARIAADDVVLLQHDNVGLAFRRQSPCGSQACRPCTKDRNLRL
jgi:hypothetical protein